jgi:serine/threonine-protein kinase
MSVSDTLIDTLFDGRYQIVRRLGAGGMANVYLAEDQELGRRVAIKILNDRHANDDQFVERFRREAKSAASLSHPNIVSIYDRGEAEGTYYIAMEHLDGRNLKELIVARGPAPVRIAIEYTRQILGALGFAHRHEIVHRDVKPHNVLVDGDGRLKVTDFGIARAGASQMTETGSIVGTAQYLSPEQARGGQIDQRSDLYSVGVVLYELLTGAVPFTGDSPVEIAMKHLSTTPSPPSALRPDIPHDLDLVVMRALAKDPDDRYQTADEMDADLERVARGASVSAQTAEAATAILAAPATMPTAITRAPSPGPSGPAYTPPPVYYDLDERPRRRRPIWPWLLALILLVSAGVGAVYAWDQIQSQLDQNEPVAVPFVEGLREALAINALDEAGLQYEVVRRANADTPSGFVYRQDPAAGQRIDPGTDSVTIFVSTGKPQAVVPNLVGLSRDQAVAALSDRDLEVRVVEVNSDQTVNTVTGQFPAAGQRVDEGSTVRINVSKGPRPVAVPSVVGLSYTDASAQLRDAGFSVSRRDVDDDQAEGTVVGQDPSGGSLVSAGTTVTLSVSRGPQTSAVPSVESLDRDTAVTTIESAGFKASVVEQPTDDPSLDSIVLSQDPAPGTQAEAGSTVTITVGVWSGVDTTQDATPPPPAAVGTDTAPQDTVELPPPPPPAKPPAPPARQ